MPAPPEATWPPQPEPPSAPQQPWTPPPAWATVQQPRGAASPWRTEAVRPPGFTSGRLTVVGLAATVVASLALIGFAWPLTDAQTWLEGFDGDRIDAVSSVGGLLSLVLAVTYLAWCHKVTDGFGWLTGRQPRVGKVAVIGWWFVPFANLVMPAVALGSLSSGLVLPGRRGHGWLVPVWWIGFLLSRLLTSLWSIQLTELSDQLSDDAGAYAATTSLLIGGEVLSIVAALALVTIIVNAGRDAAVRQRAAIGALPWPPPPDAR